MSKHEIRLRRQKFTARSTERFRNYGAVMERHQKEMRIRKIVRVFSLLFIIMIVVMMIVILVRVERKAKAVNPNGTTTYSEPVQASHVGSNSGNVTGTVAHVS